MENKRRRRGVGTDLFIKIASLRELTRYPTELSMCLDTIGDEDRGAG